MEREARKRRIMSRESDRMALITGRIRSLDESDSFSKSSSFPSTPQDHRLSLKDLPTESFAVASALTLGEDDVYATPKKQDNDEKDSKEDTAGTQFLDLPKLEEKEIATKPSTPISHDHIHSLHVTPRVSRPPVEAIFPEKPSGNLFGSITPQEINTSIISSENTRVICSFVIAVLVVMSHVNLPRNVVKSKSLISYRPLYVVLLTDVLVVAARLGLYTQRKEQVKEPKFDDDGHNWGGAFKLLELGLVLHQALRAIFIDCSFYFVIVICGLSLV